MAINPAFLMGVPIHFKKICKVYPPTLNEVLEIPAYNQYVHLLTQSQEDIWDELAEKEGEIPPNSPTPFQDLVSRSEKSPAIKRLLEEAVSFFTHEQVSLKGEVIIFTEGLENVTDISQLRAIHEDNYFDFQNLVRQSIGEEVKEPPVTDDHPKIALIKAKGRKRDRLVKKKGNQSTISLSTMLVALSCMNVGFSLLKKCGEISYLAISPLFKMAQEKEKHETDKQLIAGGADAKKIRTKYWIREIK